MSASCYASLSCNDTRNSYVEGTASIDFTSKVLSYGLPDSSKPNLLPYGELTFFDCLSAGSRFYIDLTDIGERMGRGDRTFDLWEVDMPVDLRKRFSSKDCVWIPTCVEIGIGYRYEYHPSRTHISDTQFWLADISLPDIWVVPRLSYERDVIRDNGTYLNFSLSKEIEIFDSVSIVPSVSQGWGDVRRVAGYLPGPDMVGRLDHSGLMDASFRLDLVWKVSERVSVSVFTAYSEFLFDRDIRESARNYIRQSDAGAHNRSWSIPFGLSVKVSM
ncbi:MAG: hypothetical protein IKJ37_13390 [Kiritimatiellae bacterium]|nr:hypothetical protein [Kiritimatiellia bacterium]